MASILTHSIKRDDELKALPASNRLEIMGIDGESFQHAVQSVVLTGAVFQPKLNLLEHAIRKKRNAVSRSEGALGHVHISFEYNGLRIVAAVLSEDLYQQSEESPANFPRDLQPLLDFAAEVGVVFPLEV